MYFKLFVFFLKCYALNLEPMQHAIFTRFGSPDVFQIQELPDPMPAKGEVRIAVRASGVNFADVLARQGLYQDAPKPPLVVGYEVAGIVDAVGEGVSEARLGEEVIAFTRFKGYASHVLSTELALFPKPKNLSWAQAAGIPVNYLTAWQLIRVMGSLTEDETVLIHNAGGGVGLAALDLVQHLGATAIGTASQGKHAFLKARGLHHAIDYRSEDWVQAVLHLTDGRGPDLILDPMGGRYWKQNYKLLRPTGRLGMFGVSTVTESKLWGGLRYLSVVRHLPFFNPIGLMNTNKGVFGVNMGHLWEEQAKVKRWALALMQGAEQGWVRPHIDKTFPLAAVAEAHAYIEARNNIGKIILTIPN